jgi:dUTP pyrophosphatase
MIHHEETWNYPHTYIDESISYCRMKGYDILLPTRGTPDSAGMDVYIPRKNKVFIDDFYKMNKGSCAEYMLRTSGRYALHIPSQERVLIPTGIKLHIPRKTYIDVATKSGAFKRTGLKVGSHVIDSDYQGQVFISLFNTGRLECDIAEDDSIAQLIFKHCILEEWKLKNENELYSTETERGSGGWGSTLLKKEENENRKQ